MRLLLLHRFITSMRWEVALCKHRLHIILWLPHQKTAQTIPSTTRPVPNSQTSHKNVTFLQSWTPWLLHGQRAAKSTSTQMSATSTKFQRMANQLIAVISSLIVHLGTWNLNVRNTMLRTRRLRHSFPIRANSVSSESRFTHWSHGLRDARYSRHLIHATHMSLLHREHMLSHVTWLSKRESVFNQTLKKWYA